MRNRLLFLALLLAIAGAAYLAGLFEYLAPDRLRELVASAGAWAPALLVVLFILLEPFGAPGFVFLLTSATLFSFELALLVNWLGATGAGLFGFAFARYMGRDWVASRMPARLRAWDERLSQNGLLFVVGYRLLFFLNPASHWALGLSQVPAPAAILGTALGFAPWVWVWTYFGENILSWLEAQPLGIWIAGGVAVAVIIAIRSARARRGDPEHPSEPDSDPEPPA